MPQMAPLMWFNLFVFFSVTLILFFIMNHFLKPYYKIHLPTLAIKFKKLNWKW
uniref:ATP synthase complex subunit 8 n=1 Tax=Typhlatya galapagensis TaxID=1173210 RepID=A0A1Z2R6Y9_9EUCA|nr:ATP synthase F0 subunit 8 [Typhlatya galapagensis]ASA39466.1 ATP synthase F0 subunit 8 [Typhlatya galapagensis]